MMAEDVGGLTMQFHALQDFWSDETQSNYCRGLHYTVRPDDDKLRKFVMKWKNEGKITFGGPAAQVQGKG
jgi:hypothetical protein